MMNFLPWWAEAGIYIGLGIACFAFVAKITIREAIREASREES